MEHIIIIILGVVAFFVYAGINAVVVCNIMENYKGGFDYFKSVLEDNNVNLLGKIVFIIFNLLFPIAILISIFVSLTFFFEESGYARLKKWFRRVFAKK